jgi:hypothetical protein
MATIMAPQSRVLVPVLVDDQDAARIPGKVSVGSHGYAQIWADGRVWVLHRWLLGLERGDKRMADHINGNRLDNRRSNLRVVTPSESSSNVRGRASSGFRGVYPNHGRWAAASKLNGRKIHLGTYDTPEEAAAVSHHWRVDNLLGYIDRR